ncbi:MAG: high light inducible protein [Prochlorococcus sp.]
MTTTTANEKWFQDASAHQIHAEYMLNAERVNGHWAMIGFTALLATEALTGQGLLQMIGL